MTIVDTVADRFYGDRVKMAFAFAELLNQEALALQADGVDIVQFDEPAFNVYMDDAADWGVQALERAAQGCAARPRCTSATATASRPTSTGSSAGRRVAAVREGLPGAGGEPHRPGQPRVHPLARAARADGAARGQGRDGRRDRRRQRPHRDAAGSGRHDRRALRFVPGKRLIACTNCGLAPMKREVAEAKLKALAEGAALARQRYPG